MTCCRACARWPVEPERAQVRHESLARFKDLWKHLMALNMPAIHRQFSGRDYLIRMVREEIGRALYPAFPRTSTPRLWKAEPATDWDALFTDRPRKGYWRAVKGCCPLILGYEWVDKRAQWEASRKHVEAATDAWLASHPEATCSRPTARALAFIEAVGEGKA